MTATIETVPATFDAILDHAADLLGLSTHRGVRLATQAQWAINDAAERSGRSFDEKQDARLVISDLLWKEAGRQNLSGFCSTTHDWRKVARLFRRTARKVRAAR